MPDRAIVESAPLVSRGLVEVQRSGIACNSLLLIASIEPVGRTTLELENDLGVVLSGIACTNGAGNVLLPDLWSLP